MVEQIIQNVYNGRFKNVWSNKMLKMFMTNQMFKLFTIERYVQNVPDKKFKIFMAKQKCSKCLWRSKMFKRFIFSTIILKIFMIEQYVQNVHGLMVEPNV